MSWEPPGQFEEYRIVRAIGAGAMGQVFLAHDGLLDRAVAIKFIAADRVGPAARERFLVEARAIARLSHPNVVAVYRVGEIERHPYLVSEYVRGTSLAAVPRPMPWERALRIGLGLARGLAVAHRRGVLHRDIKPANVMLGEDDEPKLLDFGLAKLLGDTPVATPVERVHRAAPVGGLDATTSVAGGSDPAARPAISAPEGAPGLTLEGSIVGTPLYLAPELWSGGRASVRSDLYALGVVMFELLVGRPPHAGDGLDELQRRVGSADAPPVASLAGDVPARFAALVDACLARDAGTRPESAEALGDTLERIAGRDLPAIEGSPYRGLSAFEPEHRAVFFGRTEEARAVVERLRTDTLVVVAGDSGAGKSSLCRAAVLPAIAEKARWRTATMVPGGRPLARLDEALASRAPDEGLLLFVDQLEELVTIAHPAEAAAVAERLAELVVAGTGVRVLASVRSDFLGRLAALPLFGELLGRSLFLLGPLGERGLRDAITGPARALGYDLAPDIVDELAGERNLPLLQFTLAELWEARDDRSRTIPAEALAKIGGVAGALARRADQVMASLGDADRDIAWRVLTRLSTGEGTRAVVSRDELGEVIGDAAAVERVVERLVAARLLAVADDRVEVAHEALFTAWPRLVTWRRTHDEGARMRDLQAEAARAWDKQGRPRGLLWRGDALADYRAWRRRWPEPPTGVEAAFAAASDADERRARRTRLAVVAALFAALAAGTAVSLWQARRADAQARIAEGEAERAAGEAARAERKFADVRSLANAMFEFDDKLQTVAGSTETRRLMVTRALAYLDRLASEAALDRDLALELAAAYMRVGDIQGDFFQPSLGDPPAGRASYAKALRIIDGLAPDEPSRRLRVTAELGDGILAYWVGDAAAAKQRLPAALDARPIGDAFDRYAFRAYLALVYLARQAGASDTDVIAAMERRVTRWNAAAPTDDTRYALAATLDVRGESEIAAADPDAGCRSMLAAQAELARLVAAHPSDARYVRERGYNASLVAGCRSGRSATEIWRPHAGDLATAEASAREAIAITETLARDGHDIQAVALHALALGQLASIAAERDPAAGAAAFDTALRIYETLSDDAQVNDPDRWIIYCPAAHVYAAAGQRDKALALARRALGFTKTPACRFLVARAHAALGEVETARALLEPVAAELEQALAKQPDVVGYRVGLASALEALAQLRRGDACALHARALAVWTDWPRATTYREREVARLTRKREGC